MNTKNEQRFLTTTAAAKRAKVSRPTISRALKEGELRGLRDNRQQWQIDPKDLDEWAAGRGDPVLHTVKNGVHDDPKNPVNTLDEQLKADLAATREKLAGERARADAAERARDQAEADRDAWRQQAQTLAARSWWPFRRR